MNWIFSEKAKTYANLQVTGGDVFLQTRYELISRSEYRAYRKEIDFVPGLTILDIACGLGRVAVYLAKQFQTFLGEQPHFILADSDCPPQKPLEYGYDGQVEYYNDLSLTREFAEMNRVESFDIFDVRSRGLAVILTKPDIVISMLGLGFHVPLKDCIRDIHAICKPTTKVILGGPRVADDPLWENNNQYPELFARQRCYEFESDLRTHEGRVIVFEGALNAGNV